MHCKNIGFKETKNTINFKNFQNQSTKSSLLNIKEKYNNLIRFFVNSYSRIFNPFLIIDSYIPRKNCIKLFFRSLGRVLPISSHLIFPINYNFKKKDHKLRKLIKVKETDALIKFLIY